MGVDPMKNAVLFLLLLGALPATPAVVRTQEAGYPITVIPPGKGPYTFPDGYQTPWEKIQILVTTKISPNLFVLHGSEGLDPAHPEASGGRAMVLFGPDGVLMAQPYRAMLVDIMVKVTTLRNQGKSLKDVLAANLTAPYDKTTLGDTQQSKDRFITEVYDEVKDFPPVVDGKRTMPAHP
jgi:hypothetical protein